MVCGDSFATQKQLTGLKGRTAVLIETLETCPACRRKRTCREMEENQFSGKQSKARGNSHV
jgi:hypothetical protein